ncbi:hypothetical protein ES288_A11G384900v1 [Gossypium darwinii]|uniref:GPI mannosyltransferase 1 n=1 Tax=Gossypium darwinii TaxID=34276 RepID=A0A5D2ET23_GOSDA|nr:hypothetical protein ES288_A11G384900v1 [Gossypium darwinii]
MISLKPRLVLLISAIFRVGLILFGEWQDTHMEVRYTEVDYLVFSGAASLMASGHSPYKRTTYRYSPLLAFFLLLLTPNSFLSHSCGKFLFSASVQAALWYGLILHFRIYPIIYVLPITLFLNPRFFQSGVKPLLSDWISDQGKPRQINSEVTDKSVVLNVLKSVFTRSRILFGLVSGTVILFCTGSFFRVYRWEFFLEFILQLVLIFYLAKDPVFCFFVQTVAFVAFNKVITAQYFVWFFCLLPLILPWSNMKLKWKGLCCIFLWMGAQTHWL